MTYAPAIAIIEEGFSSHFQDNLGGGGVIAQEE